MAAWREKALIAVTSAAAGIFALKAWELVVVPRIFAARLREIARAAREPCVLDVSKETVANYRRGGIDLIRKVRFVIKNLALDTLRSTLDSETPCAS